jgi:hypothetical protein
MRTSIELTLEQAELLDRALYHKISDLEWLTRPKSRHYSKISKNLALADLAGFVELRSDLRHHFPSII